MVSLKRDTGLATFFQGDEHGTPKDSLAFHQAANQKEERGTGELPCACKALFDCIVAWVGFGVVS